MTKMTWKEECRKWEKSINKKKKEHARHGCYSCRKAINKGSEFCIDCYDKGIYRFFCGECTSILEFDGLTLCKECREKGY